MNISNLKQKWIWATLFILFALVLSCWSLISPIADGPDEAANIIKATAVDHGEFTGTKLPYQWSGAKVYAVRVPWFYAMTEYSLECQAYKVVPYCSLNTLTKERCRFDYLVFLHSNITNCTTQNIRDFSKPTIGFTYVNKYPPDYYLLVGLPTLIMPPGYNAVYMMREVSIIISSVLLASLFLTIYQLKKRKWTFLGVLIAMTPTMFYLQSIVNGINLEGLAGMCFVFYACQMAMNPNNYPKRLLGRLCLASVILVSVRPTGFVWFAIDLIPVIILIAARDIKTFVIDRKLIAAALIIVIALLANVVWQLMVGQNEIFNQYGYQGIYIYRIYLAFINQFRLLNLTEIVGQFSNVGNYIKSPLPITIIWLLCWVGIAILVVFKGRKYHKLAFLSYLFGFIFIALLLDAYFIPSFGKVFWQANFGFAAMGGIPIFAGMILDSGSTTASKSESYVTAIMPYVLWIMVFVNFMILERWDVGGWSPIVTPAILITVEFVALVLILFIMVPINKLKLEQTMIDELKVNSAEIHAMSDANTT